MEKNFWLERWQRNEIGFHEGVTNAWLQQFLPKLHVASGAPVFVPLCGKAVDMVWLRSQGHSVLGVELSELAAEAFFKEQGLTAKHQTMGKFEQYESDGIRILCGDFFDLTVQDLAGTALVYDRASMVALPPEMRVAYASHMMKILPAQARILLIALDYPQEQMAGPPFSLSEPEIRQLYGGQTDIKLLAELDALSQNPRFASRGVSRLHERVYLFQKK